MSDAIGKMVDDDKGAHRVKTLIGAVLIAKNSKSLSHKFSWHFTGLA